jgi:hypothetical protein
MRDNYYDETDEREDDRGADTYAATPGNKDMERYKNKLFNQVYSEA